jgi:hypothetical protein
LGQDQVFVIASRTAPTLRSSELDLDQGSALSLLYGGWA